MHHNTCRYTVGDWTVWKVEERSIEAFTPDFLFPSWGQSSLSSSQHWQDELITVPASGTLRLSIHSWVLSKGEQLVILDTGIGNGRERPGKAVFHQLNTPYLDRLKSSGVDPLKVGLVINTHLHTDHVGWNTHWHGDHWTPLFPNAKYHFPKPELSHMRSHTGHLVPVYQDSVRPILEAGLHREVDYQTTEIAPGLTMVPTPGHTAGHMSVWLQSQGESAVFSGDVMHHPLQVLAPELSSVFCEDAKTAAVTRLALLQEVKRRDATYFSSHFPASSVGRISQVNNELKWVFL